MVCLEGQRGREPEEQTPRAQEPAFCCVRCVHTERQRQYEHKAEKRKKNGRFNEGYFMVISSLQSGKSQNTTSKILASVLPFSCSHCELWEMEKKCNEACFFLNGM